MSLCRRRRGALKRRRLPFVLLLHSTSKKKKNSNSCVTCGLPGAACAGHFGHIELAVPVYNPLVFG